MNLKRAVSTAVLAMIALPALAETQACSEQELDMAAAFLKENGKRKASEDDQGAIAAACKPWPGKEPYTIGVFVYEGEKQDGKRLLVALLDRPQGKVVASNWTVAEEDAIMRYVDGIRIDTARYLLQPGLRAFGVDINTYSPRYAEGGYGPMRTLYVREGAAIRPVLSDMPVSRWSYLGEMQWETGNDYNPRLSRKSNVSTTPSASLRRAPRALRTFSSCVNQTRRMRSPLLSCCVTTASSIRCRRSRVRRPGRRQGDINPLRAG